MFIGKRKDGGPESHVTGWYVEIKGLFTVCLLRFADGSRDAFHSHAFNAVSWVLTGGLREHCWPGATLAQWYYPRYYWPSLVPVFTPRDNMHKVVSLGTTWVLSFRGPWADRWVEYIPGKGYVTLTHGRVPV